MYQQVVLMESIKNNPLMASNIAGLMGGRSVDSWLGYLVWC